MATKDDQMVPYAIKPDDVLTSTGIGADDMAQSLAIGSTYILSPSVVNSFRVSGNRVAQQKLPAKYFSPADVGVKNLTSYIPQFTSMLVAGGFSLGFPSNFSVSTSAMTNFGVNDDVTFVHRSHQFAFGGGVNRGLLFARSFAWAPGVMIFAGLPNINPVIGVPPQFGPVLGTGAAVTDFLTGN